MTGARSRFVGREADARDLRRMIEGRPTLVLVQGDAGVGKSRLLAETLADGGSDHLIGACLPLRRQMSLLPFREMFGTGRPDVRRRVTRSLGSLPPGLVQGLDGVLPEQVLAHAGRAPEMETETDLDRLFLGVRALLAAMASTGPLVAAVEDAHWADPATLDLLTFLEAQLRDTEVTLVVTWRTDDKATHSPEMVEWLSNVQRAEGAEQLFVHRLGRVDVAAQVDGLLGEPAPAAIVESVYRRGEGNPFFTEQLVAAMTGTDGTPSTALPQRLMDFLRTRIRGTSTEGSRVLEALAVAARPVRARPLAEVAGLRQDEGRRALTELVDAALVEVEAGDAVRARHALLNEAVLRELRTSDRTELHRRLAGVLAEEYGDSLAAEIAGHWHEAGDPVQELRWAERAAEAAWSMALFADAAEWLKRVVSLATEIDGGDLLTETSIVELWYRAIRATDLAGDQEQSLALARTANERFRDWPVLAERAKVAIVLAHHQIVAGESQGLSLVSDVLADLEELSSGREYADALVLYASCFLWQGDADRAMPILERAVAVATESGPSGGTVRAICKLAQTATHLGDVDRAADLLERASRVAEEAGDPIAVLYVAVDRSDELLMSGRLEEASRFALESLERAREAGLGATHLSDVLLFNACDAALEQGQTDAAAELVVAVTDRPERRAINVLREIRAEVELRRGRTDESLAWVAVPSRDSLVAMDEQAEEVARYVGIKRWAGLAHEGLADGMALAERASGTDADHQSALLAATAGAAADLADIARAQRDEDALAEVRAAVARLRELSATYDGGMRHRLHKVGELGDLAAELRRADGDNDPSAWRAAAETWTGMGRPHRAAYCWWRLAQALLEQEADQAEVRDAVRRAHQLSDEHVPLRTAVDELAARARIKVAAPAVDEPGGDSDPAELPVRLTGQEIKVLGLVAEGMTNAEIGAELFISPKTVSVHVSSLLRKLGVRSRVQAAAWADRVGLRR